MLGCWIYDSSVTMTRQPSWKDPLLRPWCAPPFFWTTCNASSITQTSPGCASNLFPTSQPEGTFQSTILMTVLSSLGLVFVPHSCTGQVQLPSREPPWAPPTPCASLSSLSWLAIPSCSGSPHLAHAPLYLEEFSHFAWVTFSSQHRCCLLGEQLSMPL